MKRINRREFLKNSAALTTAALGFPYIVKSSVFGADGSTAPSNRIVMGCIGMGGQGTYNMKAFLNNPDVQVVAVCDVNRGNASYDMLYQAPGTTAGREPARAIVNNKYGNRDCAAYNDFRELLCRDDIDAVSVCTPDHWHGLISIAAAKANKDIYCEKPLVNTIAEGRALREAVKRHGRVLQTGSHERSNDSVRFACELVRNGRIGKLHTIRVNMPNSDSHHLEILKSNYPQPTMPVPDGFDYDMWLGHTPWIEYTLSLIHI